MVRRMKSSTSPMAWRCMNAVNAPWSRSGWREPVTMTWSSTDNTWRDSSSSLHMNWSTCRGAGKTQWRGEERRKQRWSGEVERWGEGVHLSAFVKWCGWKWHLSVQRSSLGGRLLSLWSTSPPASGPVSTVRSTRCS